MIQRQIIRIMINMHRMIRVRIRIRHIIAVSRRKVIAVSRRKVIAVSRRKIIAVSRRKLIAIYLIKEYGPQGPWAHKTKMFLLSSYYVVIIILITMIQGQGQGPGAKARTQKRRWAGPRPWTAPFLGAWPLGSLAQSMHKSVVHAQEIYCVYTRDSFVYTDVISCVYTKGV